MLYIVFRVDDEEQLSDFEKVGDECTFRAHLFASKRVFGMGLGDKPHALCLVTKIEN